MTLPPGTRLGAYDITALLGQGGMGEVYRARDTRLDRDVALKVLPAEFAQDTDRVARFRREAKTLAALNHPHIAQIYGFEDAPPSPGVSAGSGTSYVLAMELVEGEDLSAAIARGPIPLAEARPIASQIAEALEVAHEAGIVHRDLKPANVKVRDDGTVKVLDFGLAKAVEGVSQASAAGMNSPTITSPAMTRAGVILGTAAYMSPEQARGKPVDKRTDMWAFGCVVYEMLTGTRVFDGDTVTDVLGAIVKSEPDWSRLPPSTPPGLIALLKRCLQKDRQQRLDSAAAVRFALSDLAEPMVVAADARPTRSSSAGLRWAVAAAVTSAAITGAAFLLWTPAARHVDAIRMEVPLPRDAGRVRLAVSPDGRQLLITGGDSSPMLLRALDQVDARALPGTEGAHAPFWSPDGRQAGFFTRDQLKVVTLATGTVQTLCRASGQRVAGTWGTSEILFSEDFGRPIMRVPVTGGTPVPAVPYEGTGVYQPAFLADGRRFLYQRGDANAALRTADVLLASVDGDPPRVILENATSVRFVADDWIAFRRGDSWMLQRFDPESTAVVGTPFAFAENGGGGGNSSVQAPLTAGGRTLVYPVQQTERGQLAWVDRAGRQLSVLGRGGFSDRSPQLSADGLRVLVTRVDSVAGQSAVWVIDTRGPERPLPGAPHVQGVWDTDQAGIWLLRTGAGVFHLAPDGRVDRSLDQRAEPTSLSPDGRHLLVQGASGATNRDVVVLDTKDGSATIFAGDVVNELQGVFSPDGQWVAFVSSPADRYEVFLSDFPNRRHTLQVSSGGGVQPRWRRDGRELYFLDAESRLNAVAVQPGTPLQFGEPVPLFTARVATGPGASLGVLAQYDVSADGQRFVINQEVSRAGTRFFAIVDWQALAAAAEAARPQP